MSRTEDGRICKKTSVHIKSEKLFIFSWQRVGNHYTSRRRLAEWALCSLTVTWYNKTSLLGGEQTTQSDLERDKVWLRLVSCSTASDFCPTWLLICKGSISLSYCYLLQLGVIRRCDYHVSVQVLLFCFRGLMSHCAHFKRNFNSLFQYFHDNFLSLVMRWYRLIDSADIFRVYFSFCCAGFATLGINSKYFKYSFNFVGVWILQVTVNLKSQKVKYTLANITR